eukprot:2548083-Amphidinium_carterae.1
MSAQGTLAHCVTESSTSTCSCRAQGGLCGSSAPRKGTYRQCNAELGHSDPPSKCKPGNSHPQDLSSTQTD